MEPFLTEEHEIFRETVRKFAQREIEPLIEEAEREEKFPKQLIARARELDLLGLSIPEKYGGVGADMFMVSIVSEELVRVCAGIGVGLFSVILGGEEMDPGAIAAVGTEGPCRRRSTCPAPSRERRSSVWPSPSPMPAPT